ncbi:D-alanyl-D-alanine dipeptidase [Luteimonas cucumeris]|uniref:D-alanyl-D-alanine dipeptidase n=2 Tax=Luteimonas cucumeris TaxID=985012 RepID=A0A562L7G0_9GAMM|nr:M15 family metallopeptidase [Luteimonas cucumeris]TWI03561.1 D-alanyl-D-alanine dipeptidase [Luteimonas cucumeris]
MMLARGATLACVLLAIAACTSNGRESTVNVSPAANAADAGMVDIQALVPDMRLEIRYAGSDNFVGAPVEGYEAGKCFLHRDVAEALQRVEQDLRRENLRLKIFDCYRPRRAVLHFMRWVEDVRDVRTKPDYYPDLDKQELLGGYISPTSGHSRGATLDLTLMRCAADGRCEPLDMGTGFDFFGSIANTDSPLVDATQRANRHRLREAMQRHGFENYPMEWWHFTFKPEPTPDMAYDFPVR